MKRFYYLILILVGTVFMQSCEDDCTQDAYCQLVSSKASYAKTSGEKLTVCHNGQTLEVSESAYQSEGHGQPHIDPDTGVSTPCSDGACGTLSSDGLEFRNGEVVEIPCSYELPFLHTTSTGEQWYYTDPN